MIKGLVLEQFGPFRGRVELSLADQGLVMVRGDVTAISASSSDNGAGKTSLPHGISFCWFGEDLGGRRADAVANRFTDGTCLAHTDMEDALGPWSVSRTRRPTGLRVTGIPGVTGDENMDVLQEKIIQRLGFGLRTFKNAVVFGQGNFDRFAAADQDEKMRMLDEIQGVDFRDALARARDWRRDLQEKLAKATKDRESAEARIEEVARSVEALRLARDGYEEEKRRRVHSLRGALAEVEQAVVQAVLEVKNAEIERRVLVGIVAEQGKLEGLRERLLSAAADLAGKQAAERDACSASDDLTASVADLLKEGSCPSCRQAVKSRRKTVAKLFEGDLVRLRQAAVTAERERVQSTIAHEGVDGLHRAQFAALLSLMPPERRLRNEVSDVVRYVAFLDGRCSAQAVARRAADLRQAEVKLGEARHAVEEAERGRWSGQASLDDAENSLANLRISVATMTSRESKVARAVAMSEYWVEAFGDRGIRSMLVDGVADFVNERLAAHLEVLTCGEATIRMSATTALKKGGVREGISLATEWSWGGAGPFDGSGGQDRRKDLALFAAVQDLAESRSARPFPIKVFDEPFDALDARGKETACAWVRGIARERGTALLVTHDEQVAALAEPDQVWTVVMTKEGSHVEVS